MTKKRKPPPFEKVLKSEAKREARRHAAALKWAVSPEGDSQFREACLMWTAQKIDDVASALRTSVLHQLHEAIAFARDAHTFLDRADGVRDEVRCDPLVRLLQAMRVDVLKSVADLENL